MPRNRRTAIANRPHHITQRGHNSGTVFVNDYDRLAYLATLREFRQELDLKVYGFCLMNAYAKYP